jgi:hypothetical protein
MYIGIKNFRYLSASSGGNPIVEALSTGFNFFKNKFNFAKKNKTNNIQNNSFPTYEQNNSFQNQNNEKQNNSFQNQNNEKQNNSFQNQNNEKQNDSINNITNPNDSIRGAIEEVNFQNHRFIEHSGFCVFINKKDQYIRDDRFFYATDKEKNNLYGIKDNGQVYIKNGNIFEALKNTQGNSISLSKNVMEILQSNIKDITENISQQNLNNMSFQKKNNKDMLPPSLNENNPKEEFYSHKSVGKIKSWLNWAVGKQEKTQDYLYDKEGRIFAMYSDGLYYAIDSQTKDFIRDDSEYFKYLINGDGDIYEHLNGDNYKAISNGVFKKNGYDKIFNIGENTTYAFKENHSNGWIWQDNQWRNYDISSEEDENSLQTNDLNRNSNAPAKESPKSNT